MVTSLIDENFTILQTNNLTKTFGNIVAVDHIDLTVKRGDIFGFLGQNGSGKTTTIRLVLGLLRPTTGTIHIFGMSTTTQLKAILQRLGALIETPVFYGHLSGSDNLRVLASRSGMKSDRATTRRIGEVLDIIDLDERADDLYQTYSLGMKQRLGVGGALLTDPELILLDEPTNGLDPAGMHSMRQLIMQLKAQGKTIFLSSHLLYEVQLLCNRVAILHQGRLLRQGVVKDFLQSERIVVRMPTPQQLDQALVVLQKMQDVGNSWIRQVSQSNDIRQRHVIYVEAPLQRSSEIANILADHQLFPEELYHYQISLEEFFLDVTASAKEFGSRLVQQANTPSKIIQSLHRQR